MNQWNNPNKRKGKGKGNEGRAENRQRFESGTSPVHMDKRSRCLETMGMQSCEFVKDKKIHCLLGCDAGIAAWLRSDLISIQSYLQGCFTAFCMADTPAFNSIGIRIKFNCKGMLLG